MKKRVYGVFLAISMMLMLLVPSYAASFKDVEEGKWYSDAIDYVVANKYMEGVGNSTFAINTAVTRAQLVQILYAMEGKPEVNADMFPDVPKGKWFSKSVNWASANGIVVGYANGKFGPNDLITRQQLVAILYQYAEEATSVMTIKGNLAKYKDADEISSYAITPMKWAVGEGIISGTDKGIEPINPATRAQVAMMIMQLKKAVIDDDEDSRGERGEDGKDGLTPFIGDNGNWWIGNTDTGISASGKAGDKGKNGSDGKDGINGKDGADGKDGINGKDGADGLTPYIGNNGNWWIGGKDTGTPATSSDEATKVLKPGDQVTFIPGKKFEWTSDEGVKFNFDNVNITYYADIPFETGNNNPAERFLNNIPEDSTYVQEHYKGYDNRQWIPSIYRIEVEGHLDKQYAGTVIWMYLNRYDWDSGKFYEAYVEEDGTFKVVYYQSLVNVSTMYFAGAGFIYNPDGTTDSGYGGYPTDLKACADLPGTVQVESYWGELPEGMKSYTFLLEGKDYHGNSVKQTATWESGKIVFENVPRSETGDKQSNAGYKLYIYRTEAGEGSKKQCAESIFVYPGSNSTINVDFYDIWDNGNIEVNIYMNGKKVTEKNPKHDGSFYITVTGKDELGRLVDNYQSTYASCVLKEQVSSPDGYTIECSFEGSKDTIKNVVVKYNQTTSVDVYLTSENY